MRVVEDGPPPEPPPEQPTRSPYDYSGEYNIGVGVSALFVALAIALVLYLDWRWEVEATIAVGLGLLALYNLRAIRTSIEDRLIDPEGPDSWKLEAWVDHCGVPEKHFDRLRHILQAAQAADGTVFYEKRVRRLDRKHSFFFWIRVIPPLIGAVACLVVVFRFGEIEIRLPESLPTWQTQTTPEGPTTLPEITPAIPGRPDDDPTEEIDFQFSFPDSITIPVWLPILTGMLFLLMALALPLPWRYNYRMVTDWGIILARMPPVWLWLWREDFDRLFYDEMKGLKMRESLLGSLIGRLLGTGRDWGTVSPNFENEQRVHDLTGQPDYVGFFRSAESAHRAYKLNTGRGSM